MTDLRPPIDEPIVGDGREAGLEAAHRSVYQLLRPTPRFFALTAVVLVAAVVIGARDIARLKYATDALGNESGIGLIGVVFALSFAGSGLLFGRVVDARNPRRLYVGALLFSAVLALVNVWGLERGPLPVWWIAVGAAVEGVYFGVATPAYLKIQASVVGPGAKGAAEIVSMLRLGIGGIVGTLLAGLSDQPGPILLGCALGSVFAAFGVQLVTRSVPMTGTRTRLASLIEIRAQLREVPWIRPTIVADLVLTFALPTQLVALVIINRSIDSVTTLAFVSSLTGVLVGRLLLTVLGFRIRLRNSVLVPSVAFLVVLVLGGIAMIDDWLFDKPVLLAVLLFVGSLAMTYAQSATGALLQQQVPEDIRGAVSGAMSAARNVMIAVSGGLLAAVAVASSAVVITATLAAVLAVGLVVTGGFRGIRLRD